MLKNVKFNIKQVLLLILVIHLGGFVISCKTSKQIETIYVYKDTTIYSYEHKVSYETINLPGDSTRIKALMECDSNGRILIRQLEEEKGKFKTKVIYKNNVIEVFVSVDSLKIKQQAIEEYKNQMVTNQTSLIENKTTIKSFSWIKIFIWGFVVGILFAVLLYLGLKYLRLW